MRAKRFTPKLVAGLLLTITTCSAFAQGNAMVVGQSLAIAGCVGGVCAGVLGALRSRPLRFWPSFGIYVGILAAIASTWTGSMDVVPLTLVLGALAGLLPFAAGFYVAGRGFARLRAALARRRPPRQ